MRIRDFICKLKVIYWRFFGGVSDKLGVFIEKILKNKFERKVSFWKKIFSFCIYGFN